MAAKRRLPIEQYQVGVVCALPDEMSAAIATLDERHQPIIGQDKLDPNNYVLGRIHGHDVVVACLPSGIYGTSAAARVARDMSRTFTGLRFGLMVGIGGGIPNLPKGVDIRLGDVVISQPDKIYGGVVQYDLRKNLGDGAFERKGFLKPPPTMLLAALATLRADHNLDDSQVPTMLADIMKRHPKLVKNGYGFPGRENDTLHCPRCDGRGTSGSCSWCTDGKIERLVRDDGHPSFWYGVIATGNELMKTAAERDRIREEFGALCVEMEAAGLMNDFPCIVIRGICDYADSHKNDGWQKYAALVAAAYAKEFLGYISPEQTRLEKPIQDIVVSLGKHLDQQSSLMKEHLVEVKQEHAKQAQRYLNDQHRQCHRAFKTSTYEQFKDINPDRVDGTCQWVLSHPQYLQWHAKPHDDLLWISADPGCGKSVLTKSLVENELQNTDQHTVCYFFFKDNEEQDHVSAALCALLHQLFSQKPQLTYHAIPAWEKVGDKLTKEVPELWRILFAAARDDHAHHVTCVLDALDECRSSDRRLLIDMLAKFYTQTSCSPPRTRKGRLKFLVTSRPYDDIQAEFQRIPDNLPTIRLRGEEENDVIHQEINLVIRMRVAQLATNLKLDGQTKDRLETTLLKMEHRTYLWLYLALESIRETYGDSLRPNEALIKSLPSTVEDAYETILSGVTAKQTGNVKKILQIVVGARRPLTIQEMAIVLGIATTTNPESLDQARLDATWLESNIRCWCGLFVFINHAKIYLIHQTAKEFLINDNGFSIAPLGWKRCFQKREIEERMTQICLRFLCFEDVKPRAQSLLDRFEKHRRIEGIINRDSYLETLLVYSAEHWPAHLRDARISNNDSLVGLVSEFYDVNADLHNLWFSISWKAFRPYEKQPSLNSIQLAALLGHDMVLKLLLECDTCSDINESDSAGRTALVWASQLGHEKIVKILLDRGSEVSAGPGGALQVASRGGHVAIVKMLLDSGAHMICEGEQLSKALYTASYHGHEEVVDILLCKGADANSQGGFYGNALQAASYSGREKIAQELLSRGADVNAQGGVYGNALQAASYSGHEKIVQMLLSRGADVTAQGGEHDNAMQAASYGGHEQVLQMLLDTKTGDHVQGEKFSRALQTALFYGHKKIVDIFLNRRPNIIAEAGEHQSLLYAASYGGHRKVVQLLLDAGADIDAPQGNHGNALQAASKNGHEKVVQILFDRGASINTPGGRHGNALHLASYGGHEKVVKQLLDRGADVNRREGVWGNALQAASYQGHENIVRMLLENGAKVNAQGHYNNAVEAASYGGHESVVQMLLDSDAKINARGYGNLALYGASYYGHEKVVQMLLNRGASVNADAGAYWNALQAAARRGHTSVAQILLANGAEVSARGEGVGNAVYLASENGHEMIVQLLLDTGADINSPSGEDGNALQVASKNGHEKVVQKLLNRGASINLGGRHGNALQLAASNGHEKVVQILVEGGVNVDALDGNHGTALLVASKIGHEKVVRTLLDKGANVNAEGGTYGNALQAASRFGHERIVQMLLNKGASVNAQGGFYGNALQAASYSGHEKIVLALLSRGAAVNARGYYSNALRAASQGGRETVLQILHSHISSN